jgi:hypothetical protein
MKAGIFAIIASLVLTGCYTASNFANAKIVEPHAQQITVASGQQTDRFNFKIVDKKSFDSDPLENENVSTERDFEGGSSSIPVIGAGRIGLTEGIDAGFTCVPLFALGNPLALLLNIGADIRLGLRQTAPFYSAIGLGYSFSGLTDSGMWNGSNASNARLHEVNLPLYLRVDVSSVLAFYANPTLRYRFFDLPSTYAIQTQTYGENHSASEDAQSLMAGGNLGILVGRETKFMLEYTRFESVASLQNLSPEFRVEQFSIGIQFNFVDPK